MNRVLPPILLLLSAWALGAQTDPVTVRVLTYNIRHGQGMDGRFDLPRLAGVLKSIQPDVVALQEVDQGTERAGGVNQLDELGRMTGMHAAFGKAMNYMGGAYGVAVLSRWPFLSRENHPLPVAAANEPRTALSVRLGMGGRGPLLQFASTHLDYGRDPEHRLAQARQINELLGRGERQLAILAGDMNARADTEVIQTLETKWTRASAADPPPTDATWRPRSRVDHVFFRPAESWRVIEWTVIDETVASDHRPLLVVLEWTGKR